MSINIYSISVRWCHLLISAMRSVLWNQSFRKLVIQWQIYKVHENILYINFLTGFFLQNIPLFWQLFIVAITNSCWAGWWRISKFIQSRRVMSDEGLPNLDVAWQDWLDLISVITVSSNCNISKKNTFSRSLNKEICRMDYF